MSNPLIHAFFVGRAVADLLYEQLEHTLTDALSELGKFDAEQRERWRQFTEEAIARAKVAEAAATQGRTPTTTVSVGSSSQDLQAMIDELRAEIAQVRSQLQRYRSQSV